MLSWSSYFLIYQFAGLTSPRVWIYTLKMVFSYYYAGGESSKVAPSQVMCEATGGCDCEEPPALLSFSVDEVAEQLTVMDAVRYREYGWGRNVKTALEITHHKEFSGF